MPTVSLVILASLFGSGSASPQPIAAKTNISSAGSGQRETGFGDLAADALRFSTTADIALIPSSAFRSVDLPAAGLDSSEISSVLVVTDSPSDAYVVSKLSGKQILDALERSLSRLPSSFGGFLQVSGIKVVYDPSKDEGDRIVSASLIGGTPIAPSTIYTVALTRPLADGDMGYFQIWGANESAKAAGDSFATLVGTYAAAHQPLDVHTDGRLTSL